MNQTKIDINLCFFLSLITLMYQVAKELGILKISYLFIKERDIDKENIRYLILCI